MLAMQASLSSGTHHIFSRQGLRSWWSINIRIVSLPALGTSPRLTPSSATSRTVQWARPSGGSAHIMAIIQYLWLFSSKQGAPVRCLCVECGFQASRAVAMAHLPNCLRGQGKGAGDSRRAEARSLTAEAPGHARRFGPAGRRRAIASATQLCRPASLRSAGLDATCLKYAPKHVIMLLFYKNLFRQSKN